MTKQADLLREALLHLRDEVARYFGYEGEGATWPKFLDPAMIHASAALAEPQKVEAGGLSANDVVTALKNIGYAVECGACMEVFYTGSTSAEHSHPPSPTQQDSELWAFQKKVAADYEVMFGEPFPGFPLSDNAIAKLKERTHD